MWFLIAGVYFASQVHGNQNDCAIAPAERTAADEAQHIYTFSNDVHTRSAPNDGHCNYSSLVQISERSLQVVGGMFVHWHECNDMSVDWHECGLTSASATIQMRRNAAGF